MTDEDYTKARHPSAFHSYNTETGTFKIYHLVGGCRVSLSASRPSIALAWADAAWVIKTREILLGSPSGVKADSEEKPQE